MIMQNLKIHWNNYWIMRICALKDSSERENAKKNVNIVTDLEIISLLRIFCIT